LKPRLLLDTHIIVRWLAAPRRLSREQARALRETVRHREPVAVSAISLLEIALFFGEGATRDRLSAAELLREIEHQPAFQIIPLTAEIVAEVAALGPPCEIRPIAPS
jgi:PIN domain nuclease of toxin-antitoxin system